MAFISQIIQQHPDAGCWHQQYPWFSIGQLVHAANNKGTPAFVESARRTALFFNDIPRLHWLLHQEDTDVAALRLLVHPERISNTQNGSVATGTIPAEAKTTDVTADATIEKIPESEKATKAGTMAAPVAETSTVIKNADETATEPAALTPSLHTGEPSAKPVVTSNNTQELITDNISDVKSIDNGAVIEEQEDYEAEEPELIPLPNNRLSASLAQAADSYRNSSLDEETAIFKTAYQHTIDYFASQGIQLDSEPARDDGFGQQLKTFTSWLRQMKRLPDVPVPEADPLVESHAAHSLQKGEVVTEPMADVLLKQGKTEQAIAVLEKLRLLHPQKSHYFAARIDQLKHI